MLEIITANDAKKIVNNYNILRSGTDYVFNKVLRNIFNNISISANKGESNVTVSTFAELDHDGNVKLSEYLKSLGYNVKWHCCGDWDEERIYISWEK